MVSWTQLIADRRVILLFYQPFERDSLFRYDRYIKRVVRPLYNLTHRRQKQSGFDVWFDLLKRALTKADWIVRVNDRALAQEKPRVSGSDQWVSHRSLTVGTFPTQRYSGRLYTIIRYWLPI